MKLNESQISLAQTSFAKVATISGKAAQIKGLGSAFTPEVRQAWACCPHGDCQYDETCRNRKWRNGFDNVQN